MKKNTVIILLVLVSFNMLFGKKISLQEVKNIAQNWYTEKYDDPSKFGIKEIHEIKDSLDTYCYIVNYENKQGNIYIPAFDTYGYPGIFNNKHGNINYTKLLKYPNKYPLAIKRFESIKRKVKENKQKTSSKYKQRLLKFGKSINEYRKKWKKYNIESNKFIPSNSKKKDNKGLINTLWDQGKPNNLNCPILIEDETEIIYNSVGCVATAFTQIMKYYKFPTNSYAIGEHEYIHTQYGPQYANFSTWK